MKHNSIVASYRMVVLLVLMVSAVTCGESPSQRTSHDTFGRLDAIRNSEMQTIIDHFNSLALAANSITEDEVMLQFFKSIYSFKQNEISLKDSKNLDSHFVHNYGAFYDILFVANDGFVFHSIKQEKDHHTNLFTGHLAHSALALKLKSNPETAFVDFQPYGPSGEPAAFFLTRVFNQGKPVGWFVLQYGSNELNAMLSRHSGLGHTGEIYLVNQDHMMLSDSRFLNVSSVLQLPVNTEPVRLAFEVGEGHCIAQDYRDVRVFSSYAAVEVLNIKWALLVEIDADEVTNEKFVGNTKQSTRMIAAGAQRICASRSIQKIQPQNLQPQGRVDINELKRISQGEVCWTAGVGPCTALIAFLPGEFGYLLHLGPTDDAYTDDPLTRIFLGTRRTDLVSNLMDRITRFDVVRNDLRSLKFVIVSTHTKSLEGIVLNLLENEISLSQIAFAYQEDADYANVSFHQQSSEVHIQWVSLMPEIHTRFLNTKDLPGISNFIKNQP